MNTKTNIPNELFRAGKAAQVVAQFLYMAPWKFLSTTQVVKLVYLAEREYLNQFNRFIVLDQALSMYHGPVVSNTYDLITNKRKCTVWSTLITERIAIPPGTSMSSSDEQKYYEKISKKEINRFVVQLRDRKNKPSVSDLCDSEIRVIKSIFETYGWRTAQELSDLTHDKNKFPEYKEPKGEFTLITLEDILIALKKNSSDLNDWKNEIEIEKEYKEIFS